LFGEERGCIKLVDISIVKLTDEDAAKDEYQRMFEVNCVDGTQRVFLTETESQCEQWVSAIEQAMSNKFKSSSFVQNTSVPAAEESNPKRTGADASESEDPAELQPSDEFNAAVHIITVSSATTGAKSRS
jgi:hypothetical protein